VAVVDDGFANHPDLANNVIDAKNVSWWWSAYNGCLHGTHTAWSVSAITDNGQWVPAISHNIDLMLVTTSSGCRTLPAAYQWVSYASRNGADVVSMSFGGW